MAMHQNSDRSKAVKRMLLLDFVQDQIRIAYSQCEGQSPLSVIALR